MVRLVGREREHQLITQAAQELRSGIGGFIALTGPAGIGKTSLLRLAAAILAEDGYPTRLVAADEIDSRRPLSVVRSLLSEMDLTAERHHVDAAIGAAERIASRGPAALLVDDLHWADHASVEALRAIARRAPSLGLVLIATSRPQPPGSAVGRLVELASVNGMASQLRALGGSELREMSREHIGRSPGPRLMDVLETVSGNPFLAIALLEGLLAAGRVEVNQEEAELVGNASLPDALLAQVAATALGVVPEVDMLVRVTASIPGGVTVAELAELAEVSPTQAAAAAVALTEAGVLVSSGDTLIFCHDLLRQAVLHVTPRPIRGGFTRQMTDMLQVRGGSPARVAACVLEAVEADVEADTDLLVQLGRQFSTDNPAASVDLLETALARLSHDDARAADVRVSLGRALLGAGRAAEVEPLFADRSGGLGSRLSVEAERLRVMASAVSGRLSDVARRYQHLDVATLESLDGRADADLADNVAELAFLKSTMSRVSDARAILKWVEESPTPATPLRSAALELARASIANAEGRFVDGEAHARRALTLSDLDETRRDSPVFPLVLLAMAQNQLGDSRQAVELLQRRAAEIVVPRWGGPILQSLTAVLHYWHGDWDDAVAEFDAGMSAAEDADVKLGLYWPISIRALIACARDDLRAAAVLLASVEQSDLNELGVECVPYASALLAQAQGQPGSALTLIDEVVTKAEASGTPAVLLTGGPDLMRLCLDCAAVDLAQRIGNAVVDLAATGPAPVATCLAQWCDGLGSGEASTVESAAAGLARLDRATESGRARHDTAIMFARNGDVDAARRNATSAFETYEHLGAEQWRRQLIAGLRAHGLNMRPRRGSRRAVSGWASLTPAEQRVVDLVAEGLTNTEMGERLFVSRRTIESHLGRVYTKLGIPSRAKLVSEVHKRPRAAAELDI